MIFSYKLKTPLYRLRCGSTDSGLIKGGRYPGGQFWEVNLNVGPPVISWGLLQSLQAVVFYDFQENALNGFCQ